ncbi:MAG: hypothetical protein AB8B69_16575 [Chitinophagales bacterium]
MKHNQSDLEDTQVDQIAVNAACSHCNLTNTLIVAHERSPIYYSVTEIHFHCCKCGEGNQQSVNIYR